MTRGVALLLVAVLSAAALISWHRAGTDDTALVVYCAHDAHYAADILRRFERETGIRVTPRYDSETTKSLVLTELIAREGAAPRCDVFWNNEPLGMMHLHRLGLLEPYRGTGYRRIPDAYKDAEGYWTGFAARLRIWIMNTDLVPATPETIDGARKGSVAPMAIARPLYGTTRMHYTVLWRHLGAQGVQTWHHDLDRIGARAFPGNAHVKNQVARGTCPIGLTDTDDYYLAHDEGQPVAALPYRLADGRTICVPNTVGIIRGTRRRTAAERLVDFLLSAEIEVALATSKSRQIPLGKVEARRLPESVRELRRWADDAVPITDLADVADPCLTWIRKEVVE